MRLEERNTTSIPLDDLGVGEAGGNYKRQRYLTTSDISSLLNSSPVAFVIADIGRPLFMIGADSCYAFWKEDVKNHIADPDAKWDLDTYSGGYVYVASLWTDEEEHQIVLLEKHH